MMKLFMFLCAVILFFGIVGCPSSDAPAPKATTSSIVTKSLTTPGTDSAPIGGDTSDGDGASAVPEPATLILIGSGLVGLAVVGRKKFKK